MNPSVSEEADFGEIQIGIGVGKRDLGGVELEATDVSFKKLLLVITELEEEVKLLKNLSNPNIARYLGTVREDDTLNILPEFVPGGSISSPA
ncbi:unnamed protein product [Arabidopsis lyrata]|nr:unnamed protein product [Arabidopsis lyrata]